MKNTQISSFLPHPINDKMVAAMVANALRHEHQHESSLVKHISAITGANSHTVGKWLQAANAPRSAHLLTLARSYPQVLKGMLEAVERVDIWGLCMADDIINVNDTRKAKKPVYRDKYVPINVMVDRDIATKLNSRQLWFVGELQKGKKISAKHIVDLWNITDKTAKRDISELMEYSVIERHGSRKKGYYTVT